MNTTLSDPAAVEARLGEIEVELAELQNMLEDAAFAWFRCKRLKEKERAEAFIEAQGTVAERQALADDATAEVGASEEATFEALKGKARVLDTRAAIGMSLLRAQSRLGA